MADVIKVGEVTHTIFDINDILDIVMRECGSDTYAWLQNYLDEKSCTEDYFTGHIEKLSEELTQLKSVVNMLDEHISELT